MSAKFHHSNCEYDRRNYWTFLSNFCLCFRLETGSFIFAKDSCFRHWVYTLIIFLLDTLNFMSSSFLGFGLGAFSNKKKNRWHIRAFEFACANLPVYFSIFIFQNISHHIIYFILHFIKILFFLDFTIVINSITFCLKLPEIFHSN